MDKFQLLTEEERGMLPFIKLRREGFKRMLRIFVTQWTSTLNNCLLIQGKPGSGKTTTTVETLTAFEEEGLIAGVRRASGHITQTAMYSLLKETSTPVNGKPWVLVLDDADCLGDDKVLELAKSAFDTRSPLSTNRNVYYNTKDSGNGFKYQGLCIIICNEDLMDNPTVNQQALLDRVICNSIDLDYRDMTVFITSIIEDYVNNNEDNLDFDTLVDIVKFFNTDIRRWLKYDCFRKSKTNYSIRIIKTMVDVQKHYGSNWRNTNVIFKKLETEYMLAKARENKLSEEEITRGIEANKAPKVRVIKATKEEPINSKRGTRGNRYTVEPRKNSRGKYVNEDGIEFSPAMQTYYKNKFSKHAC